MTSLAPSDKWTRYPESDPPVAYPGWRLGDLFTITRGVSTGGNDLFIVDDFVARGFGLPQRYLRPILPASRLIKMNEISADAAGLPLLGDENYFLIDCDLTESDLELQEPALWAYLQSGRRTVAPGYVCRSRAIWYKQEARSPAPLLFAYAGRTKNGSNPFRFFLNYSRAIASNNLYMLYPKPVLATRFYESAAALRPIWQALNALPLASLLAEGRSYAAGLRILQPRELANVPADDLAALIGLPNKIGPMQNVKPGRTIRR